MLFNNNGSVIPETDEISLEATSYISEMMMLDTLTSEDIRSFCESQEEVDAAIADGILMERTIVRLDKKAKLSKATKMAVFTIAKEKNDQDFKKLTTVWRMERYLEAKLEKKYLNEAMRRAKKSVAKSANSKSKTVKKAASTGKKDLNAIIARNKKGLNLGSIH